MMQKKTFSKEFKLEILQELVSGKTTTQISLEQGIKKSLIWTWKREYNKNPEHALGAMDVLLKSK